MTDREFRNAMDDTDVDVIRLDKYAAKEEDPLAKALYYCTASLISMMMRSHEVTRTPDLGSGS